GSTGPPRSPAGAFVVSRRVAHRGCGAPLAGRGIPRRQWRAAGDTYDRIRLQWVEQGRVPGYFPGEELVRDRHRSAEEAGDTSPGRSGGLAPSHAGFDGIQDLGVEGGLALLGHTLPLFESLLTLGEAPLPVARKGVVGRRNR